MQAGRELFAVKEAEGSGKRNEGRRKEAKKTKKSKKKSSSEELPVSMVWFIDRGVERLFPSPFGQKQRGFQSELEEHFNRDYEKDQGEIEFELFALQLFAHGHSQLRSQGGTQ